MDTAPPWIFDLSDEGGKNQKRSYVDGDLCNFDEGEAQARESGWDRAIRYNKLIRDNPHNFWAL
ncbi:hypothetical protein FRC17_007529, partial [Serendipita sp. 399]